MKKIIFSLVAVLGLIGFVAQAEEASVEFLKILEKQKTAPAVNGEIPEELQKMVDEANASTEKENQVEIIADVNIRNAEASEVKKNHLKIVFDLENSMETQAGLIYGLELIKKYPDESEALMDVKTFPKDLLTVEKGGTLQREIEYQSPDYLSGDFVLWLKVKNESGLVLAMQPFQVNLAGTGRYLEQSNPCYLSIEGENEQKYNLRQGVDLKKEEKLFLNCQTKNLIGEDILVTPKFEFYRRDLYGLKINKNIIETGVEMAFAKDEDKLAQLEIPLPADPQAYDVKVVFQKEGKIISNPTVAHFVLAGKSASISQLTLDKDEYKAGETAKLGILWSGSADTFRDSRTGGSGFANLFFEIEIKSQDGKTFCVPKQTKKPSEFEKIIELKLDQDCVYPIATVRILDEGQLLYEKTINTLPEKEKISKQSSQSEAVSEKKNDKEFVLLMLFSVLIVVGIVFWVIHKKKNRGTLSIFIFLIFSVLFLFWSKGDAYALYSTLLSDPQAITYNQAITYGADLVSISLCGWGSYPVCNLSALVETGCRYRYDGYYWFYWSGTVYGCYRDVVGYSYGLDKTSVNQGEIIAAYGSTGGVKICNNGITSGIAINAKSGAPLEWVLPPVYLTTNQPSGQKYYNFSTAGWACQSYSAAFTYAFKHGYTSNLAGDYSQIGSRSISYTVNNCCTATCSTGPGCRASALTNGSVAAGTCCGGTSCYACNSGFTWNGSMCIANSCTLPWGGSIASGTSVTAYAASSVACGSSCASQTRTCTNGVLSGSYTAASCSVAACPLATASVSVSPNPVAYGSSPNFTLSSTNAIYCHVIMDGVWDWQASGYFTSGTYSPGAMTSPGTHSAWAYCYNRDWVGSGWSTTNFTVLPAPTATLTVSPTSIAYGGLSTLSWSTTNASDCWADWSGWVSVNDSVSTGALTANRTYNLTCYNSASVSTGTKTVTVSVAAAPTATLTASPTSIAYGGSSTLSWSTTNATSCWADWSGWVSVNDSVSTGALTANRTYNLTCYNSAGVSTGTKTVTISVGFPPTCSLSVSPNPVAYGGSPSFTLSSTNAYYCHVIMDGVWDWQASGYFTSGTYSPGALTSPGAHSAWCYCYNSAWVNPNGWSTTNFTVLPAPTATLTASPTPVAYGGSSTLSWSTTNATSCSASGDWTGSKTITGGPVSTGALTANRTYNLTCYNSAGVSTGTKTVTVSVAAAPTAELSASPNPIAYGGLSTLSWSTTNASDCWADWSGWVSVNDSVSTGALTANRTYNLTCYNSASVSTGTKTVTVSVAAAPTATLTASPTSIAYGGSSTLSWSTTNATSCWADWSGWVSVNDSVSTGALTANHTYNLTCYNSASVSTGTKTVTIPVAAPPTATLTASPTSIAYGGSSTLSWSTTNATSCWADWSGWVSVNDSVSTGALTANRTYNLTCYNSAGVSTGTKTVTVSVAAAPTLSFSSFPTSPATPLAYGAATTLSWSTANTTACWASGDWTGWKTNTGGSESTGALTANKTYYLECWNSAGFSTGIKTILVYVATIPAPASISGSCNSDGAVSVAWTPVTGAVKYLLRIDDQSNPWYTVSTDLLNDNVLTTTYTHTGISGHSYSAWVHACDTLSCGGAVALLSPTVCPLPTLSFTASPTTVDYNASSTLTWSVTNVSSCVGSSSDGSWGGPKPAVSMSESTGPIPASNAYYLECWNNATPAVSTGQKTVTVSLNCSPDTDCVEPTWQCNDFCGKKPYECVSYCGGDCTSVVCSSEINCGPCNSGTWREVTP